MISSLEVPSEALAYVYQGRYSLNDAISLSSSILLDAATVLCRDLLFTDRACLHSLDLGSIHDSYMNIDDGYSFMSDTRNNFFNLPWVRQCDFENHAQLSSAFLPTLTNPVYYPNAAGPHDLASAVLQYERNVQKFLEYLIILILLSGGQPDGAYSVDQGLVSELVSIRIINRIGAPRHVTVSDGVVCVSTPDVLDRLDAPCHFRMLPQPVSSMLVLYLVCVRPFLSTISCSPAATSDYLFPASEGHWNTSTYASLIMRESKLRLGKVLDLEDINLAQIRYMEKTSPGFLTPEMLEQLDNENERFYSPTVRPWDQLPSSKLLKPVRTPSPLGYISPTNGSCTSLNSLNTSFSDATAMNHSFSSASTMQHDFSSWDLPSPTLSTTSTAYSATLASSFESTVEKAAKTYKSEPSRFAVKALEFINSTPRELADNFRSHGSEITHQLCFVNMDGNDHQKKKAARSAENNIGPQRRQKSNLQGSSWDRFTKACISPLQQGQRGRPRKSSTLRSLG